MLTLEALHTGERGNGRPPDLMAYRPGAPGGQSSPSASARVLTGEPYDDVWGVSGGAPDADHRALRSSDLQWVLGQCRLHWPVSLLPRARLQREPALRAVGLGSARPNRKFEPNPFSTHPPILKGTPLFVCG